MIYLDYNATTPIDPQVLQTMLPYFQENFGNAHSSHALGKKSFIAIEQAREQIAELIQCKPTEITFTSGATEALNIALQGFYSANKTKGNHIITVQTEHKAVLNTCKFLETQGAKVSYLPVNEKGEIDLKILQKTIQKDTILIVIMYANNETGVLHPIQEISKIAHEHNIPICCDATQAIGKVSINIQELAIDLMAFSAHKCYGPKGIGALYKNHKTKLSPLVFGGGHEKNIRSGTLNVPAIIGFGEATKIIQEEGYYTEKILALRNQLLSNLAEINAIINTDLKNALPNTLNLSFTGIEATMLTEILQSQLAIATGSACTSTNPTPSHVLQAMQLPKYQIHSSIRISIGKQTTLEEINQASTLLINTIKKIQ